MQLHRSTYHTLLPDYGHPLLDAVGALGDEGEVVLAHGLLRGGEGAVGAASDLQVPAGERTGQGSARGTLTAPPGWQSPLAGQTVGAPVARGLRAPRAIEWHGSSPGRRVSPGVPGTHLASRVLRWSGVLGSGLTGGDVTKAAALAQFLLQ